MPKPCKNITGQTFGWLRVLGVDLDRSVERTMWRCICDPALGGCGKETTTRSERLTEGRSVSCGCLREARLREQETHGHSRRGHTSKEYTSWAGMSDRCYRSESQYFHHYGGRGITVCDRWRNSFENFLADMGPKPTPKHSIDRIDVNGNYEPGNCRWATQTEQMRNTRVNRLIEFDGQAKCAAEWSEAVGIDASAIKARIGKGMTPADALTLLPDKTRPYQRFTHDGKTMTLAEWESVVGVSRAVLRQRLVNGWSFEQAISVPCVEGKHAPSPVRAAKRRDKISSEGHDIAALRLNPPMIEAMAMLSAMPRKTAEHNTIDRIGGMQAKALAKRGLAEFLALVDVGRPTVALTDLGADLVATLVSLESAPENIHRALRKNMGAPMSERLRTHASAVVERVVSEAEGKTTARGESPAPAKRKVGA